MQLKFLPLTVCLVCLAVTQSRAQLVSLNPNAARVVGHPRFDPIRPTPDTSNPNLVEGREMDSPTAVAIDLSATPFPVIYVADTGNNRVLGWYYKPSLGDPGSGKFPTADFLIGQKDFFSTTPQGPSGANSIGLAGPTGLAVDSRGNLYVVDSGNNRILRFAKPYDPAVSQGGVFVIGQTSLNTNRANFNGVSDKSLAFNSTPASILLDPQGNLYVADILNHRVLRFAASDLNLGVNGPSANLVLGQTTFSNNIPAPSSVGADNLPSKDRLNFPAGLAMDSRGRLYVSDALRRVLVFPPNVSANGTPALRVMGLLGPSSPATRDRDNRTQFGDPQTIFVTSDDRVAVVDRLLSRITLFPSFDSWTPETAAIPSPQATTVLGQDGDFEPLRSLPNHGQPEASDNKFSSPFSATLTKTNELLVADSGNHRILVIPQQGSSFGSATRVLGQDKFNYNSVNLIEGREFRFVAQIGNAISADTGIVIDQNSNPPHLYVADTYNNRILGFNDMRKVKAGVTADIVIGQPDMYRSVCNFPNGEQSKPENNSLCLPAGLALDSSGNLWVADTGNARALRFPAPFAQQGFMPAADAVLGQPDFKTSIISPANMGAPYGIAFDGDARLLVSDRLYSRVLVFERGAQGFNNRPTKVLGQPDFGSVATGSGLNQMRSPQHIATDTDGRLYVADSGNNRILIFPPTVQTRSGDSALDISLTGFSNPNGVFVNQQTGEIWVSDTNARFTRRFPKFDSILLGNNRSVQDIPAPVPTIAATQDQFGNLFVADATNRIAVHYPPLLAVNGANRLVTATGVPRSLAPGMIASVCPPLRDLAQACREDDPHQFGEQTATFNDLPNPVPLPRDLADIQVLMNGEAVPLFFVSPRQINFQVPGRIDTSDRALLEVVRKSTGQTLGTLTVDLRQSSPGLFYTDIRTPVPTIPANVPVFQVVAGNQDGSVNSPSNPAARSTIVTLYGTGQGYIQGGPPDGELSPPGVTTDWKPRVILGAGFVPEDNIAYSGLAPGLIGVWQINFKIPDTTPPGANIVAVVDSRNSNNTSDPQRLQTTLAVKQ